MRDDKIMGIPRAYYQNKKTCSHNEVLRICRGIPMQQLEKEWGKVTTILADTLSGLEVGVSSETKSEFNALE